MPVCWYFAIRLHQKYTGSMYVKVLYYVYVNGVEKWMVVLVPFEVISSGCNALVLLFQQLLEGPMEVLLCERVNDKPTFIEIDNFHLFHVFED